MEIYFHANLFGSDQKKIDLVTELRKRASRSKPKDHDVSTNPTNQAH